MTKKICLSTQLYPPRIGGVAVAAHRLATNLAQMGFEVHVVAPVPIPDFPAAEVHSVMEDSGVHVHRLHHSIAGHDEPYAWRALVRRLDEESPFDLFHGFFLSALYPCVAAVETSGVPRPVVGSIRGNDALTLKDHPYLRATILSGLRKASWITSVNQTYIDRVCEDVDIRDRSSVIRNGVKPIPEAMETWRLNSDNRGVVGLVGKLRRVKDIPLLVRGYANIPDHLRKGLILAGDFSEQDEEKWTNTLIREFGLEAEVRLTGDFPQPEVFDHLRAMHVYVQSSAFEGLPNALLEAASIGVPLVATAVGGMKEVLRDGENALLVPHGDPAALGAAITRILADDTLAKHLSRGARQLAAELSPEREWGKWLDLYERLLAEPQA